MFTKAMGALVLESTILPEILNTSWVKPLTIQTDKRIVKREKRKFMQIILSPKIRILPKV